jgi:hypothetical protein
LLEYILGLRQEYELYALERFMEEWPVKCAETLGLYTVLAPLPGDPTATLAACQRRCGRRAEGGAKGEGTRSSSRLVSVTITSLRLQVTASLPARPATVTSTFVGWRTYITGMVYRKRGLSNPSTVTTMGARSLSYNNNTR